MAAEPKGQLAGSSALLAVSRVWSQIASGVLFLATSIAITPAEFGEFAIATSLFGALVIGVGQGTYEYVIKARDSDRAAPTVFFLNIVAAILVSLAALGVVAVVPHIMPNENIGNILTLLIPAFFLAGLTSLMESVVMRHGDLRQVALTTIVADTVSLIVAFGALAAGAGIFSLVFQRLTREFVITLTYGLANRWSPRFVFDIEEAKRALNFARTIVGVRIMGMGSTAIVDLTIGAILGASEAGLFRLVARLLTIGSDIIAQPFRAAIWVRLPPLQEDMPAFRKVALELLEVFGVAIFAVLTGIALIASPIFSLLDKAEWMSAAPIVAVMAAGRLVGVTSATSEAVFALRNRMSMLTTSTIITSLLAIATTLIATPYGLFVFTVAGTVATVAIQFYILPVMAQSLETTVGVYLRLMLRLSLNAGVMILAVAPLLALEDQLNAPEWFKALSAAAVGAVVYSFAARKFTPVGYQAYEQGVASVWRKGMRMIGRGR